MFLFLLLFISVFFILSFTENINVRAESSYWDNIKAEVSPDRYGEGETTIKIKGDNTIDTPDNHTRILERYKKAIAGFSGLATVIMGGLFIYNFTKLGGTSGSPKDRSEALKGCLWTGIATALLGAVTTIAAAFYKISMK